MQLNELLHLAVAWLQLLKLCKDTPLLFTSVWV